jgi:hypothetical protein
LALVRQLGQKIGTFSKSFSSENESTLLIADVQVRVDIAEPLRINATSRSAMAGALEAKPAERRLRRLRPDCACPKMDAS